MDGEVVKPGEWYTVKGVRGEEIRLRVPWPRRGASGGAWKAQYQREGNMKKITDHWAKRGVRHP